MDCARCESLKRRLTARKREYDSALARYDEAATLDVARYNFARRQAEDGRLEYQLVRVELEQHQQASHANVN
jgi:hypothetical protein